MLTKQQLMAAATGAVMTLGLGAGSLAFAQTATSTSSGQATTTSTTGASVTAPTTIPGDCHGGKMGHGHGIHGTVSAVNGTTLTVSITNDNDADDTAGSPTTYTVDASSATVLKGDGTTKPASSTLSSVAVGDTVMIDGTVSGTSVTAKMIIDGPMPVKVKFERAGHLPQSAATTTQ
jgi:hypothetical protein